MRRLAKEDVRGKKIQTRTIEISTYVGGEDKLLIEGRLRDDRLVTIYRPVSGEKSPPETVHHMIIRMQVDCVTLSIEEIDVEMPQVPDQECDQTARSLRKLTGVRLAPGFTSKVKSLIGGKRGCLHLTTLVLAMAPAILQGYWAYRSSAENREISTELIENYLLDTCRVWRKDGPKANQLLNALAEPDRTEPD